MKIRDKVVTVGDSEYQIKFVDTIEPSDEQGFAFGVTHGASRVIKVATLDDNGDRLPARQIERCLCHELVHAIFNEGSYLECTVDEPLVEWTGRCIMELVKQDFLK